MTPQYVTIAKVAELTGLTQKAIRRKIESGVWVENVQFRRVVRPGKALGRGFLADVFEVDRRRGRRSGNGEAGNAPRKDQRIEG